MLQHRVCATARVRPTIKHPKPNQPSKPIFPCMQSYDPRAKLMRQVTYRVLEKLGRKDSLLDIAMELEKIALQDEYFVKR